MLLLLVGDPTGEDGLAAAALAVTIGHLPLDGHMALELDVHVHPAATTAAALHLAGVDDLVALDDDPRPPRVRAGRRVARVGALEAIGHLDAFLLHARGHIDRGGPGVLWLPVDRGADDGGQLVE